MNRLIMLLLFCWVCTSSYAQQRRVSGVVLEGDIPLAGALVQEVGNDFNVVSTNSEGEFSINLQNRDAVIIVKMVGMITQNVKIPASNKVKVILESDTKGIDEVLVVGYGSKSRITNTGAISQISGAELRQNPSASVQNTLMGRLPGVFSQQLSGQPGSDASRFSIRGAASYSGTVNPLIIVDDIQFNQPLSDLDADQIESVTVLKDAAAVAVYGVQGADGVILIKTRRGVSGRANLSFRSDMGFQTPTVPFDFLGSYDVARLEKQAYENVGLTPKFTDEDIELFRNGTDPYGHPDVNWSDVILKKHTTQVRNNLNISGGTDQAKYFISVGQMYQDGIMKDFSTSNSDFNSNYYYKRYNFKSNVDLKITNTLALNVDLTGFTGEQNNPWLRGTSNNPFFELNDYMRLAPWAYPIYNPDGSYGGNNSSRMANLAYNVVGRMTHLGYQRSHTNGLTSTVGATQAMDFLTKGLSARGSISYNISNWASPYTRNLTRPAFPSYVYDSVTDTYKEFDTNTKRMPVMTLATAQGVLNKDINLQAALNYDRSFGNHKVYGLLLFNQFYKTLGAQEPNAFRGYSFRTGYDYKQRYMVELVGAYNGSNAFPNQNKYNLFPAVSFGWNIAEEEFFKENIHFIDLFKIRYSNGRVGKSNVIDQSAFLEKYVDVANAYNFGEVYSGTTNNLIGISEGTLPNFNIRWELEQQANYGLDLNAFKGKFRLTADYFNRHRYDIFRARQSVPVYAGAALPQSNYASMRMKGFEIETSFRDKKNNFNYFLSYNVSYTMSTILKADEAQTKFDYQMQTGRRLGLPVGYVFDGFYTAENMDSSVKPVNMNVAPGDLRYKDISGDGIINEDDKMRLQYSNISPLVMGFTFGGGYKNLSLSVTLQAGLNYALRAVGTQIIPFVNNLRSVHLDTWTPENQNATLPRLMPTWVGTVNDPNIYLSDFWNRRADYLRMKTFELAYSLPKSWTAPLNLSGVRLYTNGNNLLTWYLKDKNIYDLDPESASGSSIQSYPQMAIYNFGLQVNFK